MQNIVIAIEAMVRRQFELISESTGVSVAELERIVSADFAVPAGEPIVIIQDNKDNKTKVALADKKAAADVAKEEKKKALADKKAAADVAKEEKKKALADKKAAADEEKKALAEAKTEAKNEKKKVAKKVVVNTDDVVDAKDSAAVPVAKVATKDAKKVSTKEKKPVAVKNEKKNEKKKEAKKVVRKIRCCGMCGDEYEVRSTDTADLCLDHFRQSIVDRAGPPNDDVNDDVDDDGNEHGDDYVSDGDDDTVMVAGCIKRKAVLLPVHVYSDRMTIDGIRFLVDEYDNAYRESSRRMVGKYDGETNTIRAMDDAEEAEFYGDSGSNKDNNNADDRLDDVPVMSDDEDDECDGDM